jgi:hypothetical protein
VAMAVLVGLGEKNEGSQSTAPLQARIAAAMIALRALNNAGVRRCSDAVVPAGNTRHRCTRPLSVLGLPASAGGRWEGVPAGGGGAATGSCGLK